MSPDLHSPAFLGIGAPRCGTSWLFNALYAHDQVWLPPVKELHYFDSIDAGLDEPFRVQNLGYRIRANFLNRVKHNLAAIAPSASIRRRARPALRWDLAYFSPGSSFAWYQRLFARAHRRGLLCGEITPSYLCLTDSMIARIHERLPDLRLLVLLRDPIDRGWSGLARSLRDAGRSVGEVSQDEALAHLLHPRHLMRSQYFDNLSRWEKYYDPGQIKVGFYEDLVSRPAELYDEVCDHLGIERASARLGAGLFRPVNAATKGIGSIPEPIATALARHHVDDLELLHGKLGGVTGEWLARTRSLLQ